MPEIRIPLYGMVSLSDLEWDIVNSAPFQRLRRIRQLAFTDLVYPGATHTRFEHSIGVMHLATRAFERITAKKRAKEVLEVDLNYGPELWECARKIIRLAALSHDLGHLPFSHAAEEKVMPSNPQGRQYKHEDYSYGFIRHYLSEILENHSENAGLQLTAEDVIDFQAGKTGSSRLAALVPWSGLIAGQLDCDRMDYLRRDSHHMGVQYGSFDVERVLSTLTFVENPDTGEVRLAVEEGGLLAIESLILARYYMFMQVYFHKVRRFLDLQYGEALLASRKGKPLAPPTSKRSLDKYLTTDDWYMHHELRQLASKGCEPARRVVQRDCMKVAVEILEAKQIVHLNRARDTLTSAGIECVVDDSAESSTQKFHTSKLLVQGETSFKDVRPIGKVSKIAMAIPDQIFVQRVYVAREDRGKAEELLNELDAGKGGAHE